jgi:4'-phosphopantetheinyl transferase
VDEPLIEIDIDAIDIWRVDLATDKSGLSEVHLSADELIRADRFAFPADQQRFTRSRSALRLILSRYLDCGAGELEFQYNEHGKPGLQFPLVKDPGFNLSHTNEVAIIAISGNRNVGVDVSALDRTANGNLDWKPIAKRSFSILEQTAMSALSALPDAAQERMFHQVWCQKEAYTKGIGEGFRYGFQKFSVAVDPTGSKTGLIADEKNPGFVDDWQLSRVELDPELMVVLAYDGPPAKQVRHWSL